MDEKNVENNKIELKCPVCKMDFFFNPNIKIFISPCFHKLCEQCLYKFFAFGVALSPECGKNLRRINFIPSTFEDIEVEKEMKVRNLLSKFYKIPENPKDICKFNDWLEEYENYVFELIKIPGDKEIKNKVNNNLKDPNHILNSIELELETIEENPEKLDSVPKKLKKENIFGILDVPIHKNIEMLNSTIPSDLFCIKNTGYYISIQIVKN